MISKNTLIPSRSSRLITLLVCCFSIFAFYGCNKNDDLAEEARKRQEAYDRQMAIDTVVIKNYISTQNLANAKRAPSNSGLYYAVQVPGTGPAATVGKAMVTHYVLRNLEGDTLDTSRKIRTGQTAITPYTFLLGDLQNGPIYGYQEGVSLMKVGEKTIFLLPSGLAYGESGQGATIPPNTVLNFEIELLEIK